MFDAREGAREGGHARQVGALGGGTGGRRGEAAHGGRRSRPGGRRAHRRLDQREGQALVEQQRLQALPDEGGDLGARVALGHGAALGDVGGEGPVGELARRDLQVMLEADAHDAHRGPAQPVGVARARRLLAGKPGAGDVVDLLGDGDQAAGQRAGTGATAESGR